VKEIFLLPTKNEALFQPLPSVAEKNASPIEGKKPFRDYLQEAKAAPNQPVSRTSKRESPPVKHQEKESPPQSEELDDASSQEDVQAAVSQTSGGDSPDEAQTALPETLPAASMAVTAEQPFLQLSGVDVTQGEEEQASQGVGKPIIMSGLAISDILAQTPTSLEENTTPTKEGDAANKAFAQLLQAQDESAQPVKQVKVNGLETSQPQIEGKLAPEPNYDAAEKRGAFPPTKTEETSKSVGGQVNPDAMEKNAKIAISRTPLQTEAKSHSAEIGNQKESHTQLSVTKEAGKAEAGQASGPPINVTTPKSMEPARLAEAHRSEVVQQVAKELAVFSKSGGTSLRLQLYPEQLGRIDVRLISKMDGVQIVIHAENSSTATLLEKDLHLLRDSLIQSGVNLSGLSIGGGQAQTRSGLGQNELRPITEVFSRSEHSAESAESSHASPTQRWRDSSSTLDYRV